MSHTDLATQATTLGDRSYQKREVAALSIEMTIRAIMNNSGGAQRVRPLQLSTLSDSAAAADGIASSHYPPVAMSSAVAGSALSSSAVAAERSSRSELPDTSSVSASALSAARRQHFLSEDRSAADQIYQRTDQIQKVIDFLLTSFINSDSIHNRMGGLIGLAAVMMALTSRRNALTYEGITFLNVVIPIVDQSLEDADSRVRYYACETMYNVVKVARCHIIPFFDLIFAKVINLCADSDSSVRAANHSLNRLLQDVSTSYDHFQVDPFVLQLEALMCHPHDNVRALALDWLSALDTEPDIYVLRYVSSFLSPLFLMLVDRKPGLQSLAVKVLEDLIGEIYEYLNRDPSLIAFEERFDCAAVVSLLVAVVVSGDVHLHMQREFIKSRDRDKCCNPEWLKLLWPSSVESASSLASLSTASGGIDADGILAVFAEQQSESFSDDDAFDVGLKFKDSFDGGDSIDETRDKDKVGTKDKSSDKVLGTVVEVSKEDEDEDDGGDVVAVERLDAGVTHVVDTSGGIEIESNVKKTRAISLAANSEEKCGILKERALSAVSCASSQTSDVLSLGSLGSLSLDSIVADYENEQVRIQTLTASVQRTAIGRVAPKVVGKAKSRFEEGSKAQKSAALEWLNVFIQSGNKDPTVCELFPQVLKCILFALNDFRLKEQSVILNSQLLNVVLNMEAAASGSGMGMGMETAMAMPLAATVNMTSLMDVLVSNLDSDECNSETHIAVLSWMNSLFVNLSIVDSVKLDKLLRVCFRRLKDENECVVTLSIQVLARLSLNGRQHFLFILKALLQMFYTDEHLLELRGTLVVTELCQLLDAHDVVCTLSRLLRKHFWTAERITWFPQSMVHLLNLILFTTAELYPLRESLKRELIETVYVSAAKLDFDVDSDGDEVVGDSGGDDMRRRPVRRRRRRRSLFETLLQTWICNSVATLCLCLYCFKFSLALKLTGFLYTRCVALHRDVDFLAELDCLVHLIESPVFAHLRMRLLCNDCVDAPNGDNEWRSLFDIFSSLLSMLPPTEGFHQLRVRVEMISMHTRLFSKLCVRSPQLVADNESFLESQRKIGSTLGVEKSADSSPLLSALFEEFCQLRQEHLLDTGK